MSRWRRQLKRRHNAYVRREHWKAELAAIRTLEREYGILYSVSSYNRPMTAQAMLAETIERRLFKPRPLP